MIDPMEHGRWDGDAFVFDPPLTLMGEEGEERVIHRIDFADYELDDGITREDVVRLLCSPVWTPIVDGDLEP